MTVIPALSHIKAWAIDMDGVVYNDPQGYIQRMMHQTFSSYITERLPEKCGNDPFAVYYEYVRNHTSFPRGLVENHPTHDVVAYQDCIHDFDLSPIKPCPVIHDGLSRLPGRKILFTDSHGPFADRLTQQVGLRSLFEEIYAIEDRNYIGKPDEALRAFQAFLGHYGLDAGEVCMVDDNAGIVTNARNAGLTTVHIHGNKSPVEADYAAPALVDWLARVLVPQGLAFTPSASIPKMR